MENQEMRNDRRRPYERMLVTSLGLAPAASLLEASVINHSKVESVGQEVGLVMDFQNDVASDGGHVFNQDWDEGYVD